MPYLLFFKARLPCKFLLQASMSLMYTSCVIFIHIDSPLIEGNGNGSYTTTPFGKSTWENKQIVFSNWTSCASIATHGQGQKAIPCIRSQHAQQQIKMTHINSIVRSTCVTLVNNSTKEL